MLFKGRLNTLPSMETNSLSAMTGEAGTPPSFKKSLPALVIVFFTALRMKRNPDWLSDF